MHKTLEQFLESKRQNAWLEYAKFQVYVRKPRRLLDGKYVNVLDIANVVVDDKHRGQKIFTQFMDMVEETIDIPIYVENILNKRLINFFKKRGYEIIEAGAPSAIKRKK